MIDYIISNSNKYQKINLPYEHLYIENFLPEDFYLKLKNEVDNLDWWLDDDKKYQKDWNRYTICNFYTKNYLDSNLLNSFNEILLNKEFQKHFISKFNHKRFNDLPIKIHSQVDNLKSGIIHSIHTDKEPKYLTFVYYLADNKKHLNIGTKIYNKEKKYVKTCEYKPNSVLIFSPNNTNSIQTWHNMELEIDNIERKSIQTWFLYDKYNKPPLPFEGYKWRTDEKHLRVRRKRYKLYSKYLNQFK